MARSTGSIAVELTVDASPVATASRAVSKVHARINRQVARFASETGVQCPPGCGQCCLSPDVETTVADLLPLAEHVVQTGEAAAILERIESAPDTRCVLYRPDPENHTRGRCSMYAHRPSLCRLFGFAGRRDADGRPEFSPCWIHGQVMRDVIASARTAVRNGDVQLPLYSEATTRVNAAAPNIDSRVLPMNEALRRAIGYVGLAAALREIIIVEVEAEEDVTPPTPGVPPRAAA